MNLRDKRREEPTVNLTPLIDVVFLLLIFFMVSTSFSRSSELKVELPDADTKHSETKPEVIDVTIDANGRYFVNGQLLINTQSSTLRTEVSKIMQKYRKPSMVISADRKTPHEAVVRAMDVARQLRIVNLSIATQSSRK